MDADLIEDVNIEMSQAREITSIYTDILESTMDTYSSIINNNMNTVMRTLTSVSIIMMFPTLISSLFGMNLVNGMETSEWGICYSTYTVCYRLRSYVVDFTTQTIDIIKNSRHFLI